MTTRDPETKPDMAVTVDRTAPSPTLDVVIPVYNEETDLERCVRRLRDHLATSTPYSFRITIADNASTDATLAVARRLGETVDTVRVVHLDE